MRTRLSLYILGSLLVLSTTVIKSQPAVTAYYVAPGGNDTWSGTRSSENQNGTDGPFATLSRAQKAVRALRRDNKVGGGVTVYLRGGVYTMVESLEFTMDDSGTPGVPIVWRAYPGEQAILSGGKHLAGFKKVEDPSILSRLDPAARGHVLVSDLAGQHINNFGDITPRGGPPMELFFRQKRMTVARWPNQEYVKIADVPQTGEKLFNQGLEREKRYKGVPVGRHYGRITYEGGRPARWGAAHDIYVHGYWTWDWSDSFQKVQSIDTARHEITLAEPHHNYGYTTNQRYYYLNILEELDTPGEWYLDKARGLLYFWPPDTINEGDVIVSLLDKPLIVLDSASYLTIRGIRFAFSRGKGAVINGGTHNLIAGCTFDNLGNEAVTIDGGSENGIISCDISDVALAGVTVRGGDRNTLVAAHNFATNNHIHHYSRWLLTGQYALVADGVGNRLDHNLIHDAPHEAIYLKGNDHIIEYNEVHDVVKETGDAGAIHTGRNWTWRGNVIRYNYFHHLQGPGLHGVMGVYLDDWASGFLVYGNVFYKAGRASMIGGGRDNTIENNVYVECSPSVHVDARGLGWAGYYFDGTYPELFKQMDEMHFNQPPYSTRYPELLRMYDGETAVPKYNKIIRNVSYGGRWLDVYDFGAFDFSVVTMKDNVIADPDICRRRKVGEKGWDPYYLDIDRKEGYDLFKYGDKKIMEEFKENTFLDHDPGFVDRANGDFRLKDDSPAFKLGFKQIPVEKIGLYKDEYRPVLTR